MLRGFQQDLIDGHVPGAVGGAIDQQAGGSHVDEGVQRITGMRAAFTSSSRLTMVVCGASCNSSGSSSVIRKSASAKPSSVSLLSVSVGSIISASGAVSGKYTVGA